MSDPPKISKAIAYRKIAKNRRLLGGTQLMEGSTHYLLIRVGMGEDIYRRYYYREIEAVSLQRSWQNVILLGLLTLLLLLPAAGFLIAMLPLDEPELIVATLAFGLPALVTLIAFISTWILGGSAKFFIRTHVSEEQLATMSWKKAQRVVANLKAQIASCQAPLSPEKFSLQLARHRQQYFERPTA